MPSSDIATALSTSRPAMSRHLRVLRTAGLVFEQGVKEDARIRVYTLNRRPFDDIRHWLEDVEQYWESQLGSFKKHAEARAKKKRQ